MISEKLQASFSDWADAIMAGAPTNGIVAYTFNLAEPWSIELVGCGSFDVDDPDWACDEVYRPETDRFPLPEDLCGTAWEQVLASAREMVVSYLGGSSPGASRLRTSTAVGIGFVDGEMDIVWPT
jgi:hypothetical protein